VTVEQVRENTGWDLKTVDNVQVSEAPSAEELAALRELVAR
jgi:glutaconate CoA-transferase subunit B